ncbi:MAG: extracellular solute-binding protein [Betaproteobacteria bacterium]|nr:extracellular solute-binding protein [Betaproteobacteria bacterium]MBI3053830.1 extracellular solute-binding protein [Betaproteobacteria bacterium]
MAKFSEKLMVALALALFMQVTPAAEEPPALKAAPGAQKEQLRALIAAAIKEGELSYWDTIIQPASNNALVEVFRKQYGLPASFKVSHSLSVTTNLATRVDQEVAADRVTMDVASIASLPWVHAKVKGGHVMRYVSPQHAAYKQAFEKGLGKEGYFMFNGAYMFVPMWDAGKLNFKGTSWQDVFGAVPNGRMSVGDAGISLTYLATYIGLKPVLGIDYFKKLAATKPTFIVRSEQIAGQIVTGQDMFAFSGMPTRAYQYNQKGAKLKFMLPKEGVVLLPQATFILAKAPHPSAAKLWVDFILSEAGQKVLVEKEALISGRAGFVSPTPEYAPSIDKLNVIKIDWEKITAEDQSKAKAEWLSIFKP